jgi:hypothetical protein
VSSESVTYNLVKDSPVPYRPGYALPARFMYSVTRADGQRLTLRLEVVNRRVVCRKVELESDSGVSASDMKSVPLARWIGAAVTAALLKVERTSDGVAMTPVGERELVPAPRRTRVPDDLLQEVAKVYREALDRGAAPTRAVAEQVVHPEGWRPSRSTAGRWVYEARRRGFLGPTGERQAGERGRT